MPIRVKPAAKYRATKDEDGEVIPPIEYVPGVPARGIELPNAEAERLLKAGLVVRDEPAKAEKETI